MGSSNGAIQALGLMLPCAVPKRHARLKAKTRHEERERETSRTGMEQRNPPENGRR